MQAVTRKRARIATQGEKPPGEKTADGLLSLIKELQREDPLCSRLLKEIDSSNGRKGYELGQDGLLKYKNRVVVPQQKALTRELLYLYHDDQFAGHWGIEKTKELPQRKFYWLSLANDVRGYVLTCLTCQNITIPRHKSYGQLDPLPIAEEGMTNAKEAIRRFEKASKARAREDNDLFDVRSLSPKRRDV